MPVVDPTTDHTASSDAPEKIMAATAMEVRELSEFP